MTRGRVLPWRPEEDAYLVDNYATMPCDAIAFYLRRTNSGVWKRASRLGLSKPHMGKFQPGNTRGATRRFVAGNTPGNKGQRTRLRIWERTVALFADHAELTKTDIASLLDVPIKSISGSLAQCPDGLMHIDRWALIGRHYHAIYVAGPGDDAEKPNRSAAHEEAQAARDRRNAELLTRPEPIPNPVAWLWGVPCATDYKQAAEAA